MCLVRKEELGMCLVRKEELDEVRCVCVIMSSVFSLYRSFYDFHGNIRFLAGNVQNSVRINCAWIGSLYVSSSLSVQEE